MKKIFVFVATIMTFLVILTGCNVDSMPVSNETKIKVSYSTGVLKEVVPLTTAYTSLHNLYFNPLSYATGDWKSNFDKQNGTIKGSYQRLNKLQPPQEFEEPHALLISALEATIQVNDVTDTTVTAGGKITSDMTKKFENSFDTFQQFMTYADELKNLMP